MILHYSTLGPLLVWTRGECRTNYFYLESNTCYIVTKDNYIKGLLISPILAEFLNRDLNTLSKAFTGDIEAASTAELWMYQDLAKALLNFKKHSFSKDVSVPLDSYILSDDCSSVDLDDIKYKLDAILSGDIKPQGLFCSYVGVPFLQEIKKDRELLRDNLLYCSMLFFERSEKYASTKST